MSSSSASNSSVASGAEVLAQNGDPAAVSRAPRLHLPYLDGIRALMALYVMHNHLLKDVGMKHPGFALRPSEFVQLFYQGHYAVAVFIVLSGYCLMLPVLRDGGTLRGGWTTFFWRRARRILPPYYAALVFSAGLLWVLSRVSNQRFPELLSWESWGLHLLLLHNFSTQTIYDFNGALWSIATEWQIYWFFPFVFLPVWKRGGERNLVLIGIALGGLLTVAIPSIAKACPWFVALFAFGMIAAKWSLSPTERIRRVPWLWLGMALTFATYLGVRLIPAFGWFAIYQHPGQIGFYPLSDVAIGCATFCFLMHGTLATLGGRASKFLKVLSFRPLVWIGAFSYSLYLVHMPILSAFALLLRHFHATRLVSYSVTLLIGVPFIIAFSYGFYLLFEKPFLGAPKAKTGAN